MAASLASFDPLFDTTSASAMYDPGYGAASSGYEDPAAAYKRQQRQAKLEARQAEIEARSAAEAESVSLSTLSGASPSTNVQGASLMQEMRDHASLSKTVEMYEKAKLGNYVDAQARMGDPIVWAPTNAAWAKVKPSVMKNLTNPANIKKLQIVMRSHISQARSEAELSAAGGFEDEYELRASAQPGRVLAVRYRNDSEDPTPYAVLASEVDQSTKAMAPFGKTISFHDTPATIQVLHGHLIPE